MLWYLARAALNVIGKGLFGEAIELAGLGVALDLTARKLSANRLSLDIGVPSGRITDILNGRRSIAADTAVRLGRYFGNRAQFWLNLQSQYDSAIVEWEKGSESEAGGGGVSCYL